MEQEHQIVEEYQKYLELKQQLVERLSGMSEHKSHKKSKSCDHLITKFNASNRKIKALHKEELNILSEIKKYDEAEEIKKQIKLLENKICTIDSQIDSLRTEINQFENFPLNEQRASLKMSQDND